MPFFVAMSTPALLFCSIPSVTIHNENMSQPAAVTFKQVTVRTRMPNSLPEINKCDHAIQHDATNILVNTTDCKSFKLIAGKLRFSCWVGL